MSSNRSLKKTGWRLVAITTGKHLGTTLALLGIDAKDGHWSVSNDGHMYRIYSRLGKQMKLAARKGKTS